jgi:hypothetical protein
MYRVPRGTGEMRGMGRGASLIAKTLRLMGMNKTHKRFITWWWAYLQEKVKDNA